MTVAVSRDVHRAVLCRGTDELIATAARRLAAGLHDAGGVVAALRPDVEAGVRERLGARAGGVTFFPPLGDIEAAADHLQALGPSAREHTVVVSDVGRGCVAGDPYGTACLALESLAASRGGLVGDHTCLYETANRHLTTVARLTHPVLVDRDEEAPNPAYRSPERLRGEHPAMAEYDGRALTADVSPHTDTSLRGWLDDQAGSRGITDRDRRGRLVLAVHEALRTGAETRSADALPGAGVPAGTAPRTRLYLRGGDRFCCDVDSAWLPSLPNDRLPADPRLRGLWFARLASPATPITIHPLDHHRCRIRVEA